MRIARGTLAEQLRAWSAAHPHPGPRVQNAEDLRRVLADLERQRARESAVVLNDASPGQEP